MSLLLLLQSSVTNAVPNVKQAILDALTAEPGLNDLTKMYGSPTKPEEVPTNGFWFRDVTQDDNWSELGARRRRSNFRLGFTVMVSEFGDDEQLTEQVGWAVYDTILDVLRAELVTDSALRSTIRQFDQIEVRQSNYPAGPSSWASRIDATVECTTYPY